MVLGHVSKYTELKLQADIACCIVVRTTSVTHENFGNSTHAELKLPGIIMMESIVTLLWCRWADGCVTLTLG